MKTYLEPKEVLRVVEKRLDIRFPLVDERIVSRMEARRIAAVMLSMFTSLSNGQIASTIGYRTHSAIVHALAWYRDVVPYDARLRHDIHMIYADIKNLEPVMYEIP